MMPRLEAVLRTDRLVLRRFPEGDAGELAALDPDPEAAKLGFTEAGRFEAYGAKQWVGRWSPVSDVSQAAQHGFRLRRW